MVLTNEQTDQQRIILVIHKMSLSYYFFKDSPIVGILEKSMTGFGRGAAAGADTGFITFVAFCNNCSTSPLLSTNHS